MTWTKMLVGLRMANVRYSNAQNNLKIGVLGMGSYEFDGHVDELFVGGIDESTLRRLFACNADGSLCVCSAETPSDYAHCGRLQPECSDLPPCN